MIVSPSVSAIRKEKGVCGKNLCGFFLHDFNQPAAAAHFCLRQKWESSKREIPILSDGESSGLPPRPSEAVLVGR